MMQVLCSPLQQRKSYSNPCKNTFTVYPNLSAHRKKLCQSFYVKAGLKNVSPPTDSDCWNDGISRTDLLKHHEWGYIKDIYWKLVRETKLEPWAPKTVDTGTWKTDEQNERDYLVKLSGEDEKWSLWGVIQPLRLATKLLFRVILGQMVVPIQFLIICSSTIALSLFLNSRKNLGCSGKHAANYT